MIPVLTSEEMRAVDAAASVSLDVLVGRAGAAVAAEAIELLGGAYGRRVVVIAGKGNNGADGREAARRLRRRGAHVDVVDAADPGSDLPLCELVIDAAYGTGFRGGWQPPSPGGKPVLAVDIPSGVDASTGDVAGGALAARRTVTFAALKPGLLFGRGADLAGEVVVADIGLDADGRADLVEDADVAAWLPIRPREAHKWQSAVWVVAGSPGMTGAASLAAAAAHRAGAGYVRLSVPGDAPSADIPSEVVEVTLPATRWGSAVLDDLDRFRALVVGPGLGRGSDADVRELVAGVAIPLVVDGDALTALGVDVARHARPTTVLTPHDGEYERLAGRPPGADRLAAARRLASSAGCVVLLKGSTTVVAEPGGRVLLVAAGDARLATAGTGDVLAGVIGGLLAAGLPSFEAAAAGAHLHGLAGSLGPARGLVAGDLVDLLPTALSHVET